MSNLFLGGIVLVMFLVVVYADLKMHIKRWKETRSLKDLSERSTKKYHK